MYRVFHCKSVPTFKMSDAKVLWNRAGEIWGWKRKEPAQIERMGPCSSALGAKTSSELERRMAWNWLAATKPKWCWILASWRRFVASLWANFRISQQKQPSSVNGVSQAIIHSHDWNMSGLRSRGARSQVIGLTPWEPALIESSSLSWKGP